MHAWVLTGPCQTQTAQAASLIRPSASPQPSTARGWLGVLWVSPTPSSRTDVSNVRPPSCTFAGHSCALHRRLLRLRQLEALQQPVDERWKQDWAKTPQRILNHLKWTHPIKIYIYKLMRTLSNQNYVGSHVQLVELQESFIPISVLAHLGSGLGNRSGLSSSFGGGRRLWGSPLAS